MLFRSEADIISKSEFDNYETSYKTSEVSYNNTLDTYEKALDNLEKSYKQAQIDLASAENSLASAKSNLASASQKNTNTYTMSNEQQQLEIKRLEERLEDARIVAPIDGTITQVNIEVGQMQNGILFEIEDTEALVITTYVKDYNILDVALGQEVLIKAETTQDTAVAGEVSYIAPTTRKDGGSSNEFEVEIRVLDKESGLKIGMETRMNIIVERKEDIFYIPYDLVDINDQRQDVIYYLENDEIKEMVVETGIESAAYIEVIGEGLYEGMAVVSYETTSTNPMGFSLPGMN